MIVGRLASGPTWKPLSFTPIDGGAALYAGDDLPIKPLVLCERRGNACDRLYFVHRDSKTIAYSEETMSPETPTQDVSIAQGEYLVRIYASLREGTRIVGSRLAERLGVSASAVTQAFQRMERQGLAVIDEDRGIQLTAEGRNIAESIIRRHYLLERLLVDSLGYDWADANDEAEHLEQTLSPKLENYLYERLGQPSTCPHGNPFPGSRDEERLLGARTLIDTNAGTSVVIWRITEEGEDDPALLHFAHDNGLLPGSEVSVEQIDLRAGNIEVGAGNHQVNIPAKWAQHIRVSGPIQK